MKIIKNILCVVVVFISLCLYSPGWALDETNRAFESKLLESGKSVELETMTVIATKTPKLHWIHLPRCQLFTKTKFQPLTRNIPSNPCSEQRGFTPVNTGGWPITGPAR